MHIKKNYKFKIKNIKLDNLHFLIKKESKYYFDTRLIGFECKHDIYNVIPINIKIKNNEMIISFEINGLEYLDSSSDICEIEEDGSLLLSSEPGHDLDDFIKDNIIKKYKDDIELKIYIEYITPAEDSQYVYRYFYDSGQFKTFCMNYMDPLVREKDYDGYEIADLINYFNED